MKKILFVLVSFIAAFVFTGCEQATVAVTETNLIGRWQLVSLQEDGHTFTTQSDLGVEIWEFTENHKWYITDDYGLENSGTWSLEGNKLTIGYFPAPAIVTMTSTKLTLSVTYEGEKTIFTFDKIK